MGSGDKEGYMGNFKATREKSDSETLRKFYAGSGSGINSKSGSKKKVKNLDAFGDPVENVDLLATDDSEKNKYMIDSP